MPKILIAEEHDQIYQIWFKRQVRDIAIAHIDFHCDMRGLMIDRLRGIAYMVSPNEKKFIDDGNFLSHAVMNGIVTSVRWIHDFHGGRRHDDGGTVKYESDVTAPFHRILHRLRRGHEVRIAFEEHYFRDWDGVRPGEYLDIDWDSIASVEYQPAYIRRLMNDFLNREFPVIPETTNLVISPRYTHNGRKMFEEFATSLKKKFSAQIVRLPEPIKQPENWLPDRLLPWRVGSFILKNSPKTIVSIKNTISDKLHAYNTRHDLDN